MTDQQQNLMEPFEALQHIQKLDTFWLNPFELIKMEPDIVNSFLDAAEAILDRPAPHTLDMLDSYAKARQEFIAEYNRHQIIDEDVHPKFIIQDRQTRAAVRSIVKNGPFVKAMLALAENN